jgi:hypothetical protein
MSRYPFTYELKTERGIAFASVDAMVDAELSNTGKPSINAVFVEGENLFLAHETHLRALACAIAGEAENSRYILAALEDEAAEEFAERQMRRIA